MNLGNANILVTGAAGGIGSSIAKRLAASGAKLLLTDLKAEALERTAEKLQSNRADVATMTADIATGTGRLALAARARRSGVNVLINVAGVNPFGLFVEQAPAEIERTLLINACAPMLLCQALIPVLELSSEAHIVNIGSAFGSIGFPAFCAYSASKFAIRGFTEALRRELADTQIHVHYVSPRATRTALTTDRLRAMNEELKIAMDTPESVARAVAKALRGRRRELHLGLPERLLAKINALFPGLIDSPLRKQLPVIRRYAARPAPPETAQKHVSPLGLQI